MLCLANVSKSVAHVANVCLWQRIVATKSSKYAYNETARDKLTITDIWPDWNNVIIRYVNAICTLPSLPPPLSTIIVVGTARPHAGREQ